VGLTSGADNGKPRWSAGIWVKNPTLHSRTLRCRADERGGGTAAALERCLGVGHGRFRRCTPEPSMARTIAALLRLLGWRFQLQLRAAGRKLDRADATAMLARRRVAFLLPVSMQLSVHRFTAGRSRVNFTALPFPCSPLGMMASTSPLSTHRSSRAARECSLTRARPAIYCCSRRPQR
jgi:hypothetical protein